MRLLPTRARAGVALSALAAAALLLTGCLSIAIPESGPSLVVTPTPESATGTPAEPSTQPSVQAGPGDALACDATGAVIVGEGQRVTVTGTCPLLEVSGDGNRVDAEQADVDVLRISGQENEIEVGAVRAIALAGNDNEVEVDGGAASIELGGDGNEIDLSGRLDGGIVRGNDNEIDADGVGPIIEEGQDNDIG